MISTFIEHRLFYSVTTRIVLFLNNISYIDFFFTYICICIIYLYSILHKNIEFFFCLLTLERLIQKRKYSESMPSLFQSHLILIRTILRRLHHSNHLKNETMTFSIRICFGFLIHKRFHLIFNINSTVEKNFVPTFISNKNIQLMQNKRCELQNILFKINAVPKFFVKIFFTDE